MSSSSFRFRVDVPREVRFKGRTVGRDALFSWMWQAFGPLGLLGIHEGTLLSENAAEEGLETDSWTVDAGEAPRERDWVGGLKTEPAELYFSSRTGAERAARLLVERSGLGAGEVVEQPDQDWDARWKASFTGVFVPPRWRVLPPHRAEERLRSSEELRLLLNPGAGFGTGTHETTQLCLQVLGEEFRAGDLKGTSILDFGSGSGILAIAAALLEADSVDAVEIDPLAIENARENAKLNGVLEVIRLSTGLSGCRPYRVVIANILRPVLLEFATELTARVNRSGPGHLILSGLIEKDVPEVAERFEHLLGELRPELRALNEWRALAWRWEQPLPALS